MTRDTAIPKLLESIYAAAVGEADWRLVLEAIANEVGAVRAVLPLSSKERPAESREVLVRIGISDADCQTYLTEFARNNIRVKQLLCCSAGSVIADGRDLAFSEVDASHIQNEYYRPRGWGYAMYGWLFSSKEGLAVLGFHREKGVAGFGHKQVAVFETLIPHLRRSLLVHSQLAQVRTEAKVFATALDHLPTATLLMDARCRLVGCNSAAEALLREPGLPLLVRDGLLSAMRTRDADTIRHAIDSLLLSMRGRTALPQALNITYLNSHDVLNIAILPLPLGARVFGGPPEARVMLCLSNHRNKHCLNERLLGEEFGFTRSEAQIASHIAVGMSIEDIARNRQVSSGTVRAQVKSILRKTQTHTQVQLVGLLMRSFASLRFNEHITC